MHTHEAKFGNLQPPCAHTSGIKVFRTGWVQIWVASGLLHHWARVRTWVSLLAHYLITTGYLSITYKHNSNLSSSKCGIRWKHLLFKHFEIHLDSLQIQQMVVYRSFATSDNDNIQREMVLINHSASMNGIKQMVGVSS